MQPDSELRERFGMWRDGFQHLFMRPDFIFDQAIEKKWGPGSVRHRILKAINDPDKTELDASELLLVTQYLRLLGDQFEDE